MLNRAGFDAYTMFLFCVFFLLRSLAIFTSQAIFFYIAYIPFVYAIYRFFSTNKLKRQLENSRFLTLFQSFKQWLHLRRTMMTDKQHRYFHCPTCNKALRVPRGKGKIQVTCHYCGTIFEEKS